jgi:hypothetical protein
MPIVIEGYLVVGLDKLRAHEGHDLRVIAGGPSALVQLVCATEGETLGIEPEPRAPSLACGCPDKAEHDGGVAIQVDLAKQYRIPRSTCVGCYIGDDGPSVHSCVIHDRRYWA